MDLKTRITQTDNKPSKMKTEKQYKITTAFKDLDKYSLNKGTDSFVKSLKKEYGRNKNLSERQVKSLIEIRDSIKADCKIN